MKRIHLFIFFSCMSTLLFAQVEQGIWKGKLTQAPGGCFPEYNIELHIKIDGVKVTGTSYHFSDVNNYVKEEFEGGYDGVNRSLVINENKMVTFHIPADCTPCIKRYNLIYNKNDGNETLTGDWGGIMINGGGTCPPGKITLVRARESVFKEDIPPPAVLTQRENELVREIKVDTGTIRLDFYDNGVVDGDTISVYVNNMPIISKQLISTKPVTASIRIDLKKTQQEVIMVGDSYGSIPPNSALMIATVGDKRYQVFLNSTDKKNAMVRFVYQKPG